MTRLVPIAACALLLGGCPNRNIAPLIGEDPEVAELLGTASADDPAASPLAAARRLHQALMQQDTELAWTLLADATQRALDARGAAIGVSGRELLDASTLPGDGGVVRKVRFETIFFGPDLVALDAEAPQGDRAAVGAVAADGQVTSRTFVREDERWRLLMPELP